MSVRKLKVVLVGYPHVGKTSIANRYTRNVFANRYIFTVGCDFYIKNIEVKGQDVKLIIHDIGGQVEFKNSRIMYMKHADIVFIVFALNETSSYDIQEFLVDAFDISPKPLVILVGNKRDLLEDRETNPAKIERLAQEHGLEIVHTSAKENYGIRSLFDNAVTSFLDTRDEDTPEST